MQQLLTRSRSREDGATMVEYGLMVALVAIIAILAVTFLGEEVRDIFAGTGNELSDATGDMDTTLPAGS